MRFASFMLLTLLASIEINGQSFRKNKNKKFKKKGNKFSNKCTDCWCVPDDGPDGKCPDRGNRKLWYPANNIWKYKSHQVTLTEFEDLPHLHPEGEDPNRIKNGPSCTPYPMLSERVWLPPCEEPKHGKDDVCAFIYEEDDKGYGWNRNYGMKTYSSHGDAEKDGAVVTHNGACGVCSNANDLGIYMDKKLNEKAEQCRSKVWSRRKVRECFEDIGFTPDCAWLWATDVMFTTSRCWLACKFSRWAPANDLETCELNECNKCVEEKSGPIFELFSGRTRLNSGIVSSTTVKRQCSVLADIGHDPAVSASS